jgi:hypothetical protein
LIDEAWLGTLDAAVATGAVSGSLIIVARAVITWAQIYHDPERNIPTMLLAHLFPFLAFAFTGGVVALVTTNNLAGPFLSGLTAMAFIYLFMRDNLPAITAAPGSPPSSDAPPTSEAVTSG